ncbi:MAG TPA: hypothetical protein PLE30_01425 [Candidatus Kapabacteria bacterium]|nr:hypothetical protein [Candidatus Kapabacteria bacterium]
MSWNKIVGNDRVKRILQQQMIDSKLANSYLFTGINGIGKEAMAIEFAKTLNCEYPIISSDSYIACDSCKSCHLFDNLLHQNLELVYALPASSGDTATDKLSEAQIDEIKQQLEKKVSDPFSKIKVKGANIIRVNSIRDVKRKLALTQGTKGKRVVIVSDAERMNTEAANAFLKTLEEPNDNIIIILCTSKPDQILATIKSRCQIIKFAPLNKSDIEAKILIEHNVSADTAKIASELSMGSYTKALEYFDHNFVEMRRMIVDTLRNSLKKKHFRKDISDSLNEIIKKYDKEEIIFLLQLLSIWIRDAELIKAGLLNIANPDDIETIKSFAKSYKDKNLLNINEYIETTIYLINRNVLVGASLYSLFLNIRHYLIQVKV